ncbi:MAG: EF-P lysine aminoacylase GenX [Desulfobacteraceae bacterium]|nr:MAG: EF-P lysine aminoacylase GenX [Desulfobacteraceae bacterium]
MSPGSNHSKSPSLDQWRLAAKRPALELRAVIIQRIRAFFSERDYLEIETPCLIPAPAPETHIDAIASGKLFLQTSPELCMKRLLAAGYPRLFQICKCYRAGERGALHLPEFTMLEWYGSGMDYLDLMKDCEELIRFLSLARNQDGAMEYRGERISLAPPWERLPVADAFRRYASCSVEEALEADSFDEILVSEIEPNLGVPKPTFLCDYPARLASLSRLKKDDPLVAERFELYVARMEIANGFSELTDEREQRERFRDDSEKRRSAGKVVYPPPERFLQSLANMPESAAGIALGIDRLVMLFLDKTDIREVVAFTPEEL